MIDPGHTYELASYDGESVVRLTFMKRVGPMYPGNARAYPGTNIQDVLRVLIDRTAYLERQIPDTANVVVSRALQDALFALERRAARRHGRKLLQSDPDGIENIPACIVCGHIECEGH